MIYLGLGLELGLWLGLGLGLGLEPSHDWDAGSVIDFVSDHPAASIIVRGRVRLELGLGLHIQKRSN